MKKFGIVAVILLLASGMVFAADGGASSPTSVTAATSVNDSLNLTGYVAQKLSIALDYDNFNLGELGASGGSNVTYGYGEEISLGNAVIKSNVTSWTVTVVATNGGLYASETKSGNTLTQLIGYTFSVPALTDGTNSLSLAASASNKSASVSMIRKSAGAEAFPMKLVYNSTASDGTLPENWLSGTYRETLTLTVAAN